MSHSLQSWLDNKGFLVLGAPWGGGCPLLEPRLTFHAHAVIKTFVVEAAVVGHAEMFPEVAASSWQYSKHMWSVKLSGSSPPPRTESHWTGDPSYVWQSMPWCAIWCVSPPASGLEPLLDLTDEIPRGRWQRLRPPEMGHLIDHGRIKGSVGFTSQGWGARGRAS